MSQSLLSSLSAIQATWLLFIYRNAIEPLEYEFSLKCNYHGDSWSCILSALAPKEPHFLLYVERMPLAFLSPRRIPGCSDNNHNCDY